MEDRPASFPGPSRDELEPVLRQVFEEARAYLAGIDERAVREPGCDAELAALVDSAPDLERLAEVPRNVVCFRARPPGVAEADLDALNERLGGALLADGRFLLGTGRHDGRVALRPAISSWRTRPEDIALFVAVVRELASGLAT